jgi:Zn-dependent protease
MNETAAPGGLQVARVFGTPIYVHVSWLAIGALLSWTLATGYFPAYPLEGPPVWHWAEAFLVCGLLFVSVLLHEIAHAVVALAHGLAIRSITLFAFGGVAQMENEPEDGWTEAKIAAIGPVASVMLASVFYLAASLPLLGDGGRAVAGFLAYLNLGLAAFNLLPAFPLDGGRLLRALLWIRSGKRLATQIASAIGLVLAVGIFFFGVFRLFQGDAVTAVWSMLAGWFLKDAAVAAYERVQLYEALRGLAVRDAMLTEVATIPAHLALSELASEHFVRGGYHTYPVVRGERVVGLLTVREVLAVSPEDRTRTSVQAVMTPLGERLTVGAGEPLLEVLTRMGRSGVGRLLVVEDGRLEGLLSLSSVFRHIRLRAALTS